MKQKKKIRNIVLSLMLVISMGIVVQAASVRSDDVVYQGKTDGKYYVQAYFNPSHKVVKGEGFGLTVGKNVKQAAVRAKSDGKTIFGIKICSSYNSGWSWSTCATSKKKNTIISTPYETVKDCGTCTQRTSYTWKYF